MTAYQAFSPRPVTDQPAMFTPAFIAEWVTFMQQEIAIQQRLLGISQQLSQALIDGDHHAVTGHQQALATIQAEHIDLERKRDALRLASSRHIGYTVAELQFSHIIAATPAAQQQGLQALAAELKQLLQQVQRAQERNQQLMRTSLTLIGDTLAVIVGETHGQGYQRDGGRSTHNPPRGNILNCSA